MEDFTKHFISLGAGVQSSTMLLMAANGLIEPLPHAAIFSDTQAEPLFVYEWLNYLREAVAQSPRPIPIITVSRGSLTDASLRVHTIKTQCTRPLGTKYLKRLIPIFGITEDGNKTAALSRRCTQEYKMAPLLKTVRKLAKVRKGEKNVVVTQWIGISVDEVHRMKPPRKPWVSHRWPLVELGMRRADCLAWMQKMGYKIPPRSACYYCPFRSDYEWKLLKAEHPEEFAKAAEFERQFQAAWQNDQTGSMRMKMFLHDSCVPLEQAKFSDKDRGKFGNECEGMCGV